MRKVPIPVSLSRKPVPGTGIDDERAVAVRWDAINLQAANDVLELPDNVRCWRIFVAFGDFPWYGDNAWAKESTRQERSAKAFVAVARLLMFSAHTVAAGRGAVVAAKPVPDEIRDRLRAQG